MNPTNKMGWDFWHDVEEELSEEIKKANGSKAPASGPDGKVKDPSNLVDVMASPKDAALIAWSENVPKGVRAVIITEDNVRWEGFNSNLEALGFAMMLMPERSEVMQLMRQNIAAEYKGRGIEIPKGR